MEIKYIRDFRHNYLVLREEETDQQGYPIKMITTNTIRGLIPCQERMLNGAALLYYDITSRQSIRSILEAQPLQMKHLKKLFVSLRGMMGELESYLLNMDGLLLVPEFVYMDMDTMDFWFVYYPQNDRQIEASFRELMDFFMQHMNMEDIRLTEAVYQVADLLKKQQFVMDEILLWFEENFGDEAGAPDRTKDRTTDNSFADDMMQAAVEDIDPYGERELPKKGRLKAWLARLLGKENHTGRRARQQEIQYREPAEPEEEVANSDGDHTIFIPWVENSDNKLYGIGRNNKYHIPMERLPLTVGKMAGAVDVVLNEASVSRLHARLSRDGNRFFITDLNSTNGTFRNGMRLEPNASEIIEPGDEIGIGKLKFIYR